MAFPTKLNGQINLLKGNITVRGLVPALDIEGITDPSGAADDLTLDKFVDKLHGFPSEFMLELMVETGTTNKAMYIPKIPIYCDLTAAALDFDAIVVGGANDINQHRTRVTSSIRFNQPYFYVSGNDIWSTGIRRMAHICASPNWTRKTSVLVDKAEYKYPELNSSNVYSLIPVHEAPLDVVLGTSVMEANLAEFYDKDGIDVCDNSGNKGTLFYDKLEYWYIPQFTEASGKLRHIKIVYRCIPMSTYMASGQQEPGATTFENRIGGYQPIVLVPIRVITSVYVTSAFVDTELSLLSKRCFVSYVPRNYCGTKDIAMNMFIANTASYKEFYSDDEVSLYVRVVTTTHSTHPYNFTFGVKRVDESRVAFPQNNSLALEYGYPCDSAAIISEKFPIISISKVSPEREQEFCFNIKLELPADWEHSSEVEFDKNCGYMIVQVSSTLVKEINPAYLECVLSEHRITEVMTIKKRETTINQCFLQYPEREQYPSYQAHYDFITTPGSPVYAGSIYVCSDRSTAWQPGKAIKSINPLYSAIMPASLYGGNSNYIATLDKTDIEYWYGKYHPVFYPASITNGHGDTRSYGASLGLDQLIFPIIFPMVTHAKQFPKTMLAYQSVNLRSMSGGLGVTLSNDNLYLIKHNEFSGISPDVNTTGFLHDIFEKLYGDQVFNPGLFRNTIDMCFFDHVHGFGQLPRDTMYSSGSVSSRYDALFKSCNIYKLTLNLDSANSGLMYPYVGTLVHYSTPKITTGSTPESVDFSKILYGLDILNDGKINTETKFTFNNKQLGFSHGSVYELSNKYEMTTDAANKYREIKHTNIKNVWAIGNFLVASYPGYTNVYMETEHSIRCISTITGEFISNPIQSMNEVIIAIKMSINNRPVVRLYTLTNEGLEPLFETSATDGVLSHQPGIGVCFVSHYFETATVYSIYESSVVKLYSLDNVTGVNIVNNAGEDMIMIVTANGAYSLKYGTTPLRSTIKSSEFHFPYVESEKIMIYGLKIIFNEGFVQGTYPVINPNPSWKYDLKIYVNDILMYTGTNLVAKTESIIRFEAVPGGMARYEITNCQATIRDIKWLFYKAPYLNEDIPLGLTGFGFLPNDDDENIIES